jgi:sugar phosphate isomerase/epimerase
MTMARPVTLFTGQWADLPLETVAEKAAAWGFDGLEIACWGDHFEVDKALADENYLKSKRELLEKYHFECWAISNHLVGQAVCDNPIDRRHRGVLPDRIWGDGEPEGVRRRAAEEMKDTARAAAAFGVKTVVGFTGSSVWVTVGGFPPVPPEMSEGAWEDFADRWNPIIDVFDEVDVRFASETHPTEAAFDYWTTEKALETLEHRSNFGINFDPSHFMWQDVDPIMFLGDFADRIYHVHCKESVRHLDGRNGRLASNLPFGDLRRGWDYVTVGHGDVPWEHIFRKLTEIGYAGPLSVEWEDSGMDRELGAPEALAYVRKLNFEPSVTAFDAAYSTKK